jgi:hypothetical protein
MNLHSIASRYVSRVNAMTPATMRQSTGAYTTTPDGTRTPLFQDVPVSAQIQPISGKDLQHVEGLNLQGTLRAGFISGDWRGIVRADALGGDLLVVTGDGLHAGTWRIVYVFETWPGWSKVALCLQA